MAKRRKKSKMSKNEPQPQRDPIYIRRAMERDFAAIGRLLDEKHLESIEEANKYLQQFIGLGKTIPPTQRELTPLEKAQEMVYEALEETVQRKRIALAHRALTLSPDCADAHVLLAEQTAQTPEDAKKLYEQGVKAGERALGQKFFDGEVGHFWGILESRPYMRSLLGLAQALWALGDREEAIVHYKELLRLNPNDNQGVRYLLLNALFKEGLDDDVETLLAQYKDEASAEWGYGRALWTFRRFGTCPKADKRLKEALKENRFVPLYLLGIKIMPKKLPEYMSMGDTTEAIHYVADAYECWAETPGAFKWLENTV